MNELLKRQDKDINDQFNYGWRDSRIGNWTREQVDAGKELVQSAVSEIKDVTKDVTQAVQQASGWVAEQGEQAWDWAKEEGFHNTKKVALAVPRGAYLSLLALNFKGHASAIKRYYDAKSPKWYAVKHQWWVLGGDTAVFLNTVKIGAKKKPIFGESKKFSNVIDPATQTLIAEAIAVLTSIIAVIGKTKEEEENTKQEEAKAKQEAEKTKQETEAKAKQEAENKTKEENKLKPANEENKDKTKNILIYGGIAVVLAGISIFVVKKLVK